MLDLRYELNKWGVEIMKYNGKRNRAEIIQAAGTLFLEHGYAKTSLKDIADVAGVPIGNMYYYFKTKESLLKQCYPAFFNEPVKTLEAYGLGDADQVKNIRLIIEIAQAAGVAGHETPIKPK